MEHISQDDIIQIGLSAYKTVGESMTNNRSLLLYIYRSFNITIMLIILIAILVNLFHVEGGMYIRTVEGSLTVIHILTKYSVFLIYKPEIRELLKEMVHFWNYRETIRSNGLNKSVEKIYKFVKIGLNGYFTISVFALGSILLRPAFNNKNNYIFHCWVPDSIIIEATILFCQYYFISIIIGAGFAYDLLYISYTIHVIIQLKLLKYKLRNLVTNMDVYDCVKHHQFLHSIFHQMNRVYFWIFLFHYFITLITGCTQLYVILLGNVEFIDLISTVVYNAELLVQFGYWAFLVDQIVFEMNGISNAIYMSKWYEEDRFVKKVLLTIMIRAQRQKYMSAGGLMDMNIDAFGSVVRKIFSFYAILRNMV